MNKLIRIKVATLFVLAIGYLSVEKVALPSQSAQDTHADMVCTEMVAHFPVDFTIARSLVPPEYELVSSVPGTANLLFVAQDCDSVVIDGRPLDKVRNVHAWIQVTGAYEVDPVPGTVTTLPTMYWYSLFSHTTDPIFLAKLKAAGQKASLIKGFEMSGDPVRSGVVTQNNNSTYSWVENITKLKQVVPLGVNHRVSVRIADLMSNSDNLGVIKVRCTLMNDGRGIAILQAGPGSALEVFGPVLQGNTQDWSPMYCGVEASRDLFPASRR
ncbi:MAG: hypothetical protein LAP85_29675 [Acidobacteriia bacterium]|nr:hypothetical protein [Terriglobia bacterium]